MMAMSAGVVLQSKAEGGVMKSLKRAALGGESFFVSTYTAPAAGGFVDIAARLPGDVDDPRRRRPARRSSSQKGSWLANEVNVNIDTRVGRVQEHVRRRGRIHHPRRGSGHRRVRLLRRARRCGTCRRGSRSPSTPATWSPTRTPCRWACARPAAAGWCRAARAARASCSTSPALGRVWTQTRNPNELLGWIQSFVGTGNSSGSSFGGALGGLLGRD